MTLTKARNLFLIALALGAVVAGALALRDKAAGDDQPAPAKAVAGLPLGLAGRDAPKPEVKRETKHCILLWMSGGPSQIDTFDLKPGNPNGGPFQEIDTKVKDVRISEHLPKLARWTDRMAIVRSLTHPEGDHNRATFLMRTGRSPGGGVEYPAFTAALAKELSDGKLSVPPYVSINPAPYGILDRGFLPAEFKPLTVRNPDQALGAPPLDEFKDLNKDRAEAMRDGVKKAFDLTEEKKAVRDAYGPTPFGQGCLLARRLIEAGVPVVEVSLGGWDTHQDNFDIVKGRCEVLDPAWATLMNELDDRKLLDKTLIVWMGEFGRTPKINAGNGRDHYPAVSTVVLAGAIKGGVVVGKTGDDGTTVTERPVALQELHATIYKALGIDPAKTIKSALGEPVPLVEKDTSPIKEILK